MGANIPGQVEWKSGMSDEISGPRVFKGGELVIPNGDGDEPVFPLLNLWYHYNPTNAPQTNTLADLSGQGNDGVKAGAGDMAFIENSASIVAHMDAESQVAGWDLTGLTNSGGTVTFISWVKNDSADTSQMLLHFLTGDMQYKYDDSGNVTILDGASTRTLAATPDDGTWHMISVEMDSSAPSIKYFIDNEITPAATSQYTTLDLGGTVGLLFNADFATIPFEGQVSRMGAYTNTILAADRISIWENTRVGHGAIPLDLVDPSSNAVRVVFNMEYINGTVSPESSTNNNQGVVSGAIFAKSFGRNTVPMGYSSFDGVNDVISSESFIGISGSGARTTECWVRRIDPSASDTVLMFGNLAIAAQAWRLLFASTADTLELNLAGAPKISWNNVGLIDDKFHHVAITYEAGTAIQDGIKLYIDGVDQGSPDSVSSGTTVPNTIDSEVYVGANDATGNPLQGDIDGVRIYNIEKTSAAILASYTNTLPAHDSRIQFDLDDTDFASLQIAYNFSWPYASDVSASNNLGTIAGAAHAFTNSNGYLVLDGSNDKVTATKTIGVIGSVARTHSVWVNRASTGTGDAILDSGAVSSGSRWIIYFTGSGGDLSVDINGSFATWASISDVGNWHMITVTLAAGAAIEDAKLYIDGVDQGDPDSTTGGTTVPNTSVAGITFGDAAAGGFPFHGSIDGPRVYITEKTAAEVLAMYNATKTVYP